jgi:eukaryotic-like serine/threonine-protein kinase
VRFDLGPGPHVIQIEHACCVPYVKQVTADEAARQGEIRIPLEARPARLRVEGDPATRVYVEGRLLGTAGESQRASFSVPVPDGGESPYEASAQIVMQPPGGGVARQVAIRLRAGAEFVVAGPAAEEAP